MIEEKYIWCRNCNEIHHVNPFDKSPVYRVDQGEEREVAIDDWRAFMERHAGHRLEGLEGTGEKYFPSGHSIDPMSIGYAEVTNGRERFLVRSSRKGIEHPLNFELIPGRLKTVGTTVRVQEDEIRKEMRLHFSWGPTERLDNGKIESFVSLFKETVKDLDANDIRSCSYDYSEGSVVYGLLEPRVVETLLQRCEPRFSHDELLGIRRFIESNRKGGGVMALVIEQHYQVEDL
jgi:hypothetical protein